MPGPAGAGRGVEARKFFWVRAAFFGVDSCFVCEK